MNTQAKNLLADSCRIALAAYLHGLGKFAERACVKVNGNASAFGVLERNAPDLIKRTDPFINAADAHHKPETFLHWIIATADRVASGLDNDTQTQTGKNQYQARQLSLLEQVRLNGSTQKFTAKDLKWRYPLKALSPSAIFPELREKCEPVGDNPAQAQYRLLWKNFLSALEKIPHSHRSDWPLWLDHFDTAWLTYAQAIPAATALGSKPEVSLYDHNKTTAALATALWRWHEAEGKTGVDTVQALKHRSDFAVQKFLLIQGDFFGIQDFVFAEGSQTNKAAAKLLRGRSFQVSLFTELAALKVLDALSLPPTSQITNAAGKFLIVAPNTPAVKAALKTVSQEINQWFLDQSFGLAGLGLVGRAASCDNFLKGNFENLMKQLFGELEKAKLQRFGLLDDAAKVPRVFAVNYPHGGVCQFNGRLPADLAEGNNKASAALSRDQITLGSQLVRKDRILITPASHGLRGPGVVSLDTPVFGYSVSFTGTEDETGMFSALARQGTLLRAWDFSLPTSMEGVLWHGYARRFINAYVPQFKVDDELDGAKYQGCDESESAAKTFNHIACEDRTPLVGEEGWQGQAALMTLKGDVDNLGMVFQKGLQAPTFAKMAALSRQMNAFFAIWLPAVCATEFPNTYTVFAGGDDFFLIGPWHSTQKLAVRMSEAFKTYVAHNPEMTFSAGMVMTKPGLPVHSLANQAEEALKTAKGEDKNALLVHGERVKWPEWPLVQSAQDQLERVCADYTLSTSYVYGLLQLVTLAADKTKPEHAMWRSRFAYRTQRYVFNKIHDTDKIRESEERKRVQEELSVALGQQGIKLLGTRYRIALFNHFYQLR